MLCGKSEQLGQRVVEVVAAGYGCGGRREELARGSILKRWFARHAILPGARDGSLAAIVRRSIGRGDTSTVDGPHILGR